MKTEKDSVHNISSDPPVIECNVHYIKLPGTQEDINIFLCEKNCKILTIFVLSSVGWIRQSVKKTVNENNEV